MEHPCYNNKCCTIHVHPTHKMEESNTNHDRKKKAIAKINRLRIIDNFEADYNLVLKIYRPKITNLIAEKNDTLDKN